MGAETVSSIELKPGQIAMFGYGSLLSRESMEVTLGHPYPLPNVVCSLDGWGRSWDVMMPNTMFYEESDGGDFVPANVIYLNVTEREGSSVNGLLYVVDADQIEGFDRREWIYDRRNVAAALRGVEVQGGEVYVYAAKPEWIVSGERPREWAAIRQSYLDVVEKGLSELGSEFRAGYDASTDAVRAELVFADKKYAGTPSVLAVAKPGSN